MKEKFREVRLSKSNLERLDQINDIIEEYQSEGYVLTLRQLYYQLVSRDVIPNKVEEYAKLSKLLKEGRMGGIVDWSAIEDRLRVPSKPSAFDSPADIIDACISQYQLPRMNGQPKYIEVWVEKDALSGVLKRVTEKYHIPIMVNRGYSSVSAMYDAFQRFVKNGAYEKREVLVLYLGDFDPSGLDMIRDIENRITEFQDGSEDGYLVEEMNFEIRPIALTEYQIQLYKPPPNPAKRKDPRYEKFSDEHGTTSWEVDALRPEVLNDILKTNIEDELDMELYQQQLEQEYKDILILKKIKKDLENA